MRSVVFDIGETLTSDTRYWGDWARLGLVAPQDPAPRGEVGAGVEEYAATSGPVVAEVVG
ncbi:hypothetical protein ACFRMQ_14745 [Kitasatospora sp. NPDC056783]|uniref:hypothetical protein n=1 Tax=Kitasatospora sp. NPDC056783 TaxID=3345943 RepID=UPI0036897F21